MIAHPRNIQALCVGSLLLVFLTCVASSATTGRAINGQKQFVVDIRLQEGLPGSISNGDPTAPVQIIYVGNYAPELDASILFFDDLLPRLNENFVAFGTARIIATPYFTSNVLSRITSCIPKDMQWDFIVGLNQRKEVGAEINLITDELVFLQALLNTEIMLNMGAARKCVEDQQGMIGPVKPMTVNPIVARNSINGQPKLIIGRFSDRSKRYVIGRRIDLFEQSQSQSKMSEKIWISIADEVEKIIGELRGLEN